MLLAASSGYVGCGQGPERRLHRGPDVAALALGSVCLCEWLHLSAGFQRARGECLKEASAQLFKAKNKWGVARLAMNGADGQTSEDQ